MDRQTAVNLLDNLISMVEDTQENDYDTAIKMGIEALKACAQSVRRGKWVRHHEPFTWMGYSYWTCSECGFGEDWNKRRSQYCPNCGARMDMDFGERKDGEQNG